MKSSHHPRSPKVIAIGLDAADPELLVEWAIAGHMPNLHGLMQKGVIGRLQSPPGMADDAVWASFSTGVWPTDHGRFDYLARLPGHYEPVRFQDHHFVHRPFWEFLDSQGVRVAVLDVPKSPQARLVHGIEVNNFRVHGVDGKLTSRPPALAEELSKRFSPDQTDRPDGDRFVCEPGPLSPADRSRFIELTRQSVVDKTGVALALLEQGCDFFLTVFKEAHCVGHKLWPPGPDMQTIYAELDSALGRLLRSADSQTTTIVFTNLGMSCNYHGNAMLDQILRRLERRLLSTWSNLRIESDKFVHRVSRRLGLNSQTQGLKRRLAFIVPSNDISGAIRINLTGREPNGRVAGGTEHHRLCDRIEAEMMGLRNVETGQPVVRNVVRLDLSKTGTRINYLPDMLVVWHRDAPIRSVKSHSIGVVHARNELESPGNHVEGGFYVAAGPDHSDTGAVDATGRDDTIVDLAPTIAELFGLQLPNAAGRAIPSIVATTRHAVRHEESSAPPLSLDGQQICIKT